jgi:hypothetical protein
VTTFVGDRLGVAFGILAFILEFVFVPIVLLYFLWVKDEKLQEEKFQKKFGWLYANIKVENRWQRAYRAVFVGRRWLLLFFGFGMTGSPAL